MVVFLTGASHTGKTLLAQRLMEEYHYPYLSIDHLKMGLIRSGNTKLTPEDDIQLQEYLWPILRGITKTVIENRQNLIVEGCYIPFHWKEDFALPYLAFIRFYPLVMTEEYIKDHFAEIKQYANVIENRRDDSFCKKELILEENRKILEQCRQYGWKPVWIRHPYDVDLDLNVVWESERLLFRFMTEKDFPELCQMLQDPQVMYAWEHTFTEEEVHEWIEKRIRNYKTFGYDYFLAIDKQSGAVVGQIGVAEEWTKGRACLGLGYILKKEYWHMGYAAEGAEAMLAYARYALCRKEVIACIRPENKASRKVAEHIGMREDGFFVKTYREKDMQHLIYHKSLF